MPSADHHIELVCERAQSVMAAGGINAVDASDPEDSIESHISDTLEGGRNIAGREAVTGLCAAAPDIVAKLERYGTVFTRNSEGMIDRRAFGGQSHRRTCYCGSSTGKRRDCSILSSTGQMI